MNKFAKFFLILLVPLFLFFAKVPSVYACSCAGSLFPEPFSILKAFGDYDAVFTGKVVDTKLESEKDNYEITVDILETYKYSGGLTQVKIFTNDPNGTTCGYPARKDKEYLFYANETQQGDWSIYSCSKTGELADRMEDISFLDKLKSFDDTAFKIYKRFGLLTLLPILHKEAPEVFGIVSISSSVVYRDGTNYISPVWGEGMKRNVLWFDGWKVYVNLFIWTITLAMTLFFIGKIIFSKIKKTKPQK